METKKYRFDEVTINFDKKRIPLSSAQREKRQGTFRYYGAQGVIDHVDDYIFDGTYLLIAEDGENLKSKKQNIAQVVDGQFWVNNHAHIVQGNEQCDTRFLCYLINSMDLLSAGQSLIFSSMFSCFLLYQAIVYLPAAERLISNASNPSRASLPPTCPI